MKLTTKKTMNQKKQQQQQRQQQWDKIHSANSGAWALANDRAESLKIV